LRLAAIGLLLAADGKGKRPANRAGRFVSCCEPLAESRQPPASSLQFIEPR